MKGVFEHKEDGHVVGREEWSLGTVANSTVLKASGGEAGDGALDWTLDARFTPQGLAETLELQVRPSKRPAEVSTFAFRSFGGRGYGTLIGPGGVPEKLDTAFAAGSAVRGFSTALDGVTASALPVKAGHGRRLLVVSLEGPELNPTISDAMLLARSRQRAQTPEGEGWCIAYELRWAQDPGRAAWSALVAKSGLVLRAEWQLRDRARTTELASFTE